MATKVQQSHALANFYVKKFEGVHGVKPADFNLYRDRRGFEAMAEQLGYERAKDVIDYYMKIVDNPHTCKGLLYNYEKFNLLLIELEEDEKRGAVIREETRKRVEEWRAARGDQRG